MILKEQSSFTLLDNAKFPVTNIVPNFLFLFWKKATYFQSSFVIFFTKNLTDYLPDFPLYVFIYK